MQPRTEAGDEELESSNYSLYKQLYLGRTGNRPYLDTIRWEKKQLLVCTVCRIVADVHQAFCIPLLLILSCLLTTFLIGFKTGRRSLEGWGVVLIPAQLLTFCFLSGFAQAKIVHACSRNRTSAANRGIQSSIGVRSNRETTTYLCDGHWRSEQYTLCGAFVDNIASASGGCVRWLWYPVWLFPLAMAVLLLSLKVYGAIDLAWGIVLAPALLLMAVAPCSVVPALLSSERFLRVRTSLFSGSVSFSSR